MPFVILLLLIIIGVILYTYSYKGGDKSPAPKKASEDPVDDPFNVVYFNEVKDAQEVKEVTEDVEEPEAPVEE